MSVVLTRASRLETIQLEQATGIDGQGKPSYGAAVELLARVVGSDDVVRTGRGEEVQIFASVWISGDQSPLPRQNDRVTTAAGLTGIVVQRMDGEGLRGALDHVELKLREE